MLTTELLEGARKKCRFEYRPDTQDQWVAEQVLIDNEYLVDDHLSLEDVVIDLGANIGAFAMLCLGRGAGEVWCFEPDPDNFKQLKKNLALFHDKVQLHQEAVWRSDQREKVSLIGMGPVLTACSFVNPNPSGMPTTKLDDVLIRASMGGARPIRLMKIDVEGAEFEILQTAKHLGLVQEIVGECHAGVRGHSLAELVNCLKQNGFHQVMTKHSHATMHLFWAAVQRAHDLQEQHADSPRRKHDRVDHQL